MARSSGGGCWQVESARVQRKGAPGPAGSGWRTEGGGGHPRSILGVAALTVKGVLRYEGVHERKQGRERERGRQ